jgi:hypothetical protein
MKRPVSLSKSAWLGELMLAVAALAIALSAAFLAGCGDNLCGPACAAQPDGGPAGPFVARNVRFVPDEGAGPGAIHLQLAGVDLAQSRFALRVVGDGLEAFGVAGRLTLDNGIARVESARPGSALASDGVTVHAATAATPTGVMLGFTRAGDKSAARLDPALGIGSLDFTALKPGTTRVAWAPGRARVLDGALQPVEAQWIGGTLIVD